MQSFIISGKSFDLLISEAKNNSLKLKVHELDIEILEFETLGIEDVRNIQKKIFLKPLKGERKSLVILLRTGITDEAQNSMLKLLEEPPVSSFIYILIQNHLALLPTILSRVKVTQLKEERESDENAIDEFLEITTDGEALSLAQELSKDKNAAILWLEELILSAREKMLKSLSDKKEGLRLRKLIHKIELTHYDLKTTNANPRLALENLFLNI